MDFDQLVDDTRAAADRPRPDVEAVMRAGRRAAEQRRAERLANETPEEKAARASGVEALREGERRRAAAVRRSTDEWNDACRRSAAALRRRRVRRDARIGWLRRRGCWVIEYSQVPATISGYEAGEVPYLDVRAFVLAGDGRCYRVGPHRKRRGREGAGIRWQLRSTGSTVVEVEGVPALRQLADLVVRHGARL